VSTTSALRISTSTLDDLQYNILTSSSPHFTSTTLTIKTPSPSLKMATAFESSLSASSMRPPLSSAVAPSMADSLPNINFGFEDLRNRMAQFTARFDAFIEKGRKRVLEERNQFRINMAEMEGNILFSDPVQACKLTRHFPQRTSA
jgi:hypothetical protein